jgi:hypothetical protein
MKLAGFTSDNWNSAGNNLEIQQKLLQLENIKKGMGRKSSKENNSKASGLVGGGGASLGNQLIFTNQHNMILDNDDSSLLMNSRPRHPPTFVQSQTQYENWI